MREKLDLLQRGKACEGTLIPPPEKFEEEVPEEALFEDVKPDVSKERSVSFQEEVRTEPFFNIYARN